MKVIKESTEKVDAKNYKYSSFEYNANEGRKARIARYRGLANISDDFEITKDNIDSWALDKTCVENNCTRERLTAELLGER